MPTGCMLGTLLRLRTENSAVVPKMSPRYQLLFKNKTTRSCSCIAHPPQAPCAGSGSWHIFCFPEELRPSQASQGREVHGCVCVCVCVQPCCLHCPHVVLISLFLGAMTSSAMILDTDIVRQPWEDWAWPVLLMSLVGRAVGGNTLTCCLQDTLLPGVVLRSGPLTCSS